MSGWNSTFSFATWLLIKASTNNQSLYCCLHFIMDSGMMFIFRDARTISCVLPMFEFLFPYTGKYFQCIHRAVLHEFVIPFLCSNVTWIRKTGYINIDIKLVKSPHFTHHFNLKYIDIYYFITFIDVSVNWIISETYFVGKVVNKIQLRLPWKKSTT